MEEKPIVKRRRDISADVLKSICCICVIVIHTASHSISTLDTHSFGWYSALFWGVLCRFAVPIFFMVTGALLIDPARELGIKRIFTRYFLRILACLWFWSFIYILYFFAADYIFYRTYSPTWFIDAVKGVLNFHHHFHLYYLQIILLFYVLLPILRGFVKGSSRSTLLYALIVWFALGILLPYLFNFYPFTMLYGIPGQYPISMAYAACGYCLLGYYIKSANIERRHFRYFAAVYLVGFFGIAIPTVLVSHASGETYLDLLEAFTPGATVMSVGVCGMVTAYCRGKTEEDMPLAVRLSKASFCIYLVHHFFVMALRQLLAESYCTLPIITVPAMTALVFGLSILVYLVLRRIPIVNKYLI